MSDKSDKQSHVLNYEEFKDFHKKKNDLFVDILSFFYKEPESFYMFPDELIGNRHGERLKEKIIVKSKDCLFCKMESRF